MRGVTGRGRATVTLACTLLALPGASVARAAETVEPRLLTTAISGLGPLEALRPASWLKGATATLETLSPAGGPSQVLAKAPLLKGRLVPSGTGASWSGDGATVAFAAGNGKHERIFLVSSTGGRSLRVAGTRGGTDPVLSPDGQTIAFSRSRSRYRVDKSLIPYLPKGIKPPKTKLVYSSTSTWLVDASGGHPRRLTPWRNGLHEQPTSFSPDGTTLALTSKAGDQTGSQVALADLASGGQTVVAAKAEEAAISPDGTRIAYVGYADADVVKTEENDRYVAPEIYVKEIGSETALRLTHSRGVIESAPSWDQSGSRIAYVSARADTSFLAPLGNLLPAGNSVMQMNADGSCPQRIASHRGIAFYGAAWQSGPGREAGPISC